MTKKRKILLVIVILLLLISIALCFLYFSSNNKTKKQNNIVKTVDKIEEYNYSIKENDSKVKRTKFKELKEILDEDPVDYQEYALKLAEISVLDIYDLNSKVNKYDVGGLEYVLPEHKDKLKIKLQDTLYSSLEDNIDGNRKQKLPIVSDTKASFNEKSTTSLNGNSYDSYSVKVTIDYKEDMGYDNTVSVKMINKDNKLFVILIEPI